MSKYNPCTYARSEAAKLTRMFAHNRPKPTPEAARVWELLAKTQAIHTEHLCLCRVVLQETRVTILNWTVKAARNPEEMKYR